MTLPVPVGRLESGEDLVLDLAAPWHTAIQGMSRSGKSVLLYGILGRIAARPDVVVGGLDPTGVLLGPWSDHPHPELRAVGARDLNVHMQAISALCSAMDDRIDALLAAGLDKSSEDIPLLLVVCEEYPSTLALCAADDAAAGRRPGERLLPMLAAGILRLVQEGAKARVRVLLLCQRMDASVVGGATRSNLGTRLTMRVDNGDAVRMLHPMATLEEVEMMTRMKPGVGVVERPGENLTVFKADFVEYGSYVDAVRAGARQQGSGHGNND